MTIDPDHLATMRRFLVEAQSNHWSVVQVTVPALVAVIQMAEFASSRSPGSDDFDPVAMAMRNTNANLRAEVAERLLADMTTQRNLIQALLDGCRNQNFVLSSDRDNLKKMLRMYGGHVHTCDVLRCAVPVPELPCSCGFKAAWDEWVEGKA